MLDGEGLTENKMLFQCSRVGLIRLKKTSSLVTVPGGYSSLRKLLKYRVCVCLQLSLHRNVSFSIMSSSFINFVEQDRISFFLKAE